MLLIFRDELGIYREFDKMYSKKWTTQIGFSIGYIDTDTTITAG